LRELIHSAPPPIAAPINVSFNVAGHFHARYEAACVCAAHSAPRIASLPASHTFFRGHTHGITALDARTLPATLPTFAAFGDTASAFPNILLFISCCHFL